MARFVCLPHEIVERDYGAGDIQRGVENICEVICEGIHLKWMANGRPLLVGRGFLIHLSYLLERIAGRRTI